MSNKIASELLFVKDLDKFKFLEFVRKGDINNCKLILEKGSIIELLNAKDENGQNCIHLVKIKSILFWPLYFNPNIIRIISPKQFTK